jgi:hypothetical protein
MYFDKFPKILYTLDQGTSGQVVPDILRRVKLSNDLKNNSVYYDLYDVKDGERPEVVADRFYGDSQLHWIILHINDIVDPRFDWPLSNDDLLKFCIQKYGLPFIYHTHHYVNPQGKIVNSYKILSQQNKPILPIVYQDSGEYQSILFHQTPTVKLTRVTNYEYELGLNENKRRIKIVRPELVSEITKVFEDIIAT